MKNIFKIFLCFFVLSLSFTLISCGKNKEDDNKKTEVEESGDHEHDFSKWVTTKEPTCTKDGQKVRECDCGEKEKKSIPATGHEMISHPGYEGNCSEIGWPAYETCDKCGYSTYKEYPGTDHVFGDWWTVEYPTCTTDGYEQRECYNCDYIEHNPLRGGSHELSKEPNKVVYATCTEDGYAEFSCLHCEYVEVETYKATGHNLSDWTVTTSPTCTTVGYQKQTCYNCDYYVTEVVPVSGHVTYRVDGITPTCDEAGYDSYDQCSYCSYNNKVVIPALGHTMEGSSCTGCDFKLGLNVTTGSYTFVSIDGVLTSNNQNCNSTTATYTITFDTKTTISFEFSVSSESGWDKFYVVHYDSLNGINNYSDYYSGTYYGSYSREVYPGDVISFEYSKDGSASGGTDCAQIYNLVIECAIKEASCTSNGQYARFNPLIESFEYYDVDAYGHDLTYYNGQPATCTTDGYLSYEACSRCDYTTYQVTEYATGHVLNVVPGVAPTCQFAGYNTYEFCQQCDYTTREDLPATDHDYCSWYVVTPATCISYGVYMRTCNTCGHEEIDEYYEYPLDHDYGEWNIITAATCYDNGYRECVCQRDGCGDVMGEHTSSLGHDYIATVIAPTCTTPGITQYDCSRCDAYYEDNYTFETGHWICYGWAQEATCEVGGHDEYEYCGNEGCDYTTLVETTPALGHDLYTVKGDAPTCTMGGNYDYESCNRCDYNTYEYHESLGHDYGAWVTIEDESCTLPAIIRRDCSRCDDYEEEYDYDRPAFGHTYGEETVVAGSETTQGYKYKVCATCDYVYKYDFTETALTSMFTFREYGGGYQVTGVNIPRDMTTVEIPAEYNGKPVVSIQGNSISSRTPFYDCDFIKVLIIPATVTEIGQNALSGAYNLEEITMPAACQSLSYVFYNAKYTNYDNSTFPSTLTKVTIVGDLDISVKFFYTSYTNNIKTINITEGVKIIGDNAFTTCTSLETLYIPETLEEMGDDLFLYTYNLQYNYYENIKYLGNETNPYLWLITPDYMYETSYTIHEDTKYIAPFGFRGCNQLLTIEIPANVVGISKYAFWECYALGSVVIPNNVTSLGQGAFGYCTSLTNVTIGSGIKELIGTFKGCSSLTEIVVPEGVELISGGAFFECSSLVSIYLPLSATRFGDAYDYCQELANVYYGGTFEDWMNIDYSGASNYIGMYVYKANPMYYAENLYITNESGEYELVTAIYVEEGTEEIDEFTYYGLDCITHVYLPRSVQIIEEDAFFDCDGIKEVHMYLVEGANLYNLFPNVELINFDEDGLTAIPENYFKDLSSLKRVILPDSVKTIGANAFYNCISLEAFGLPHSLVEIGESAFNGCSAFDTLVVPMNVTTIDAYAFSSTGLTFLYIPENVTEVKYCAFGHCTSLETVTIKTTNITLGAFVNSTNIKNINMPIIGDRFGYIWGYDGSYYNNSNCPSAMDLVEVTGTYIPASYFSACEIKELVLDKTFTEFGDNILRSSSTKIYYKGTMTEWNYITKVYNSDVDSARKLFYTDGCIHEADLYWRYDSNDKPTIRPTVDYWTTTKHATCTETGTQEGYCTNCNEVIQESLPMISHDFDGGVCTGCGLAAYTMVSGSTYGFTLNSNGWYQSTNYRVNKSTAIFTITANTQIAISFDYEVSSESNCDYLYVLRNSSIIASISGTSSYYRSSSLTLNAGEQLVFKYTKDSGTHSGNDRAYFRINEILIY